jgi:choline dehydrogenase-like flavoprotein
MTSSNYDLIVVGTGFASTFFLKKYLSKAPASAKILVLERGHLYPHVERVKHERGEDTPFAKLNVPHHDTFINKTPEKHWIFQPAFGGSSNCWSGCTPRFLPTDFQMKSLYGVANDWPLQYNDLEPYYSEAEEIMDISGPEDTPFPRSKPYPLPPHTFTAVDKILKEKYGNLYISQPTARASRPVNGRSKCCASAVCSVCPVNAKFTVENSNMNVYEDGRIELIYGAQVQSIDLQQNIAKKITFIKDNKEHQAAGEVFALGANAIFNAHILLNSGDANPFTGKCLGEQAGLEATVFLKELATVGGSTWVNANGYMLYDGEHRKEYAACLMETSNYPFIRIEKGKWRHMAKFRMVFEDLPDRENHVATTADKMKPQVYHKGISTYTVKGIERMKKLLPEILSCLPVEKIEYQEPFNSEAHILGTTRMSSTAAEGVVDKHLIHHQYRNLFVLGSGSFTTYTPANPTLTLSALSLHAANSSF